MLGIVRCMCYAYIFRTQFSLSLFFFAWPVPVQGAVDLDESTDTEYRL